MNLDIKDKKALSDIRSKKAFAYLDDAEANLKESRYGTSVNRSYYAVLNAARALLVLEGVNPLSHNGVMTMLSLRFVQTGLLPKTMIRNFKVLLSRRTDVDYGDFEWVDAADAEDSFQVAKETIGELEKVRKSLMEHKA
jgi:uncharacterized protein (UPF0332 family)